jgi:predicted ribonuclease YlaK
LKKRVAEALKDAETQPEVAAAVESQKIAEERAEKLRAAQRVLNQYAKDARERLSRASEATVDVLVESAAERGKPEFGKLSELVGLEIKNRYASRALEQIAEHRIPLAQMVSLRGESHAMLARARAIERIAQDRAERVLTRMREAVTEEMVLPVDLSKGVAGALLAHAAGLKRRAVQLSENADELERSYTDRQREKEGRA